MEEKEIFELLDKEEYIYEKDKFIILLSKIKKLERLVLRNQELLCELLNRDGLEGYIDNEDVTFKVILENKKTGKSNYKPEVISKKKKPDVVRQRSLFEDEEDFPFL